MPRGRRKNQNRSMLDLQVVILLVVSVLLVVLIYAKSGYIGKTLSPILGGIMGWIKYIIPIGTFAIAIYLAIDEDKENFMRKIFQYTILLLCISTIITVIQVSQGKFTISGNFEDVIKEAYARGTDNMGGGAVGAIFAVVFINLLDNVGSIILTVGIALMTCIYLFNIKPALMLKEYIERKNERKKQAKEQKSKYKQLTIENLPNEKEMNKKWWEHKNISITEEPANIRVTGNENQGDLFKKEEEIKKDNSKEVLTLKHALTVEDENYQFPPINFLKSRSSVARIGKKTVTDTANKLQKTLYSFGVAAKVENVSVGPSITRYELKPAEGVRVNKIASLADDLALSLAAQTIRIEAPIPGKQAVGIEIPNSEKEIVSLRDIIDSNKFKKAKSKLSFALGKDAAGEIVITDISQMPHALIAGSTGSGKSVCINTLITSIIYKAKPSEVKLVMIDPKVVELSIYNGIPHLLIPVVTDPKKAAGALSWAVKEMVNRYHLFAEKNVRDISGYNEILEKEGVEKKLPQIVIIIDELADLMMVARNDVEDAICRLAQMARAAGMHLIIATQRPSVDVITGIIKANISNRISFAVSSQVDSRTILDLAGAEKLLGKGDMLFFPTGVLKPIRIQGAFISEEEVERIVNFLKKNGETKYSEDVLEEIEKVNSADSRLDAENEEDPFLTDAIDTVLDLGQASASFIQRRFKVGYARAGRIIDQMEAKGIISGYEGSKPRRILMSKEQWQEMKMKMAEPTEESSEE